MNNAPKILNFNLIKTAAVLTCVVFFGFASVHIASANLATGMSASVVIGQADFTSNSANQGGSVSAATLNNPRGVYSDGTKLFVADKTNNRVLIYNTIPTSDNASADVVIGQPDFTSNSANQGGDPAANTLNGPYSVFYVGGKLIISDWGNHRVLIYNSIPTENNASADVVIGQPDFTSNSVNQGNGNSVAANTLNQPTSIWSDGTKLLIADAYNYRVLIFNSIPTENDSSADVVIGQPDLETRSASSAAANEFDYINYIFVYDGKLLVTDSIYDRVLIFNSIPTENNASADIVLGQEDFESAVDYGTTASSIRGALGIFGYADRLFISDYNRVMVFDSIPETNNAPAVAAVGQPDLTSNTANQGGSVAADTLNTAIGVYANSQKLIVGDYGNHRVLIYDLLSTPTNFDYSVRAYNSMEMAADSFSNTTLSPNKYYFSRSDSTNSGWITSPTWTDTGLTCNTEYAYTAKYGTGDGLESETASLTISTMPCPGSPGGGASVSTFAQTVQQILTQPEQSEGGNNENQVPQNEQQDQQEQSQTQSETEPEPESQQPQDMTPDQIQAKIQEIREQLISLLTQVIQLLTEEIANMR